MEPFRSDVAEHVNYGEATMDHKSRVLIPKRVMKALGLKAPGTFTVRVNQRGDIILTPSE